jgi:hypothetical protein
VEEIDDRLRLSGAEPDKVRASSPVEGVQADEVPENRNQGCFQGQAPRPLCRVRPSTARNRRKRPTVKKTAFPGVGRNERMGITGHRGLTKWLIRCYCMVFRIRE